MWKRDQTVPPSPPPPAPMPPARPMEPVAVPAQSRPVEKLVMDLGKSVVIKGELSGSEDLTLYGQMEGSVKLPDHTLTIGPHADIKAEISAKARVPRCVRRWTTSRYSSHMRAMICPGALYSPS